jgi:iron complex outermembrane recepter protein
MLLPGGGVARPPRGGDKVRNHNISRWGRRARAAAPAFVVGLSVAPSGVFAQTALPDINMIAPSPLPPHRAKPRPAAAKPQQDASAAPAAAAMATEPATGGIDRDKVPANTQVLTSKDFDHTKAATAIDALVQALPGASVSDQNGNPFQRDLNYRGFTASPVIGTPQGIAVYQNGVRINEIFGDTVNWDLIPDVAVNRMALVPNNPVYGLNALGGAISIEMKNGFTYQGKELEVMGGSYGRIQESAQAGVQDGNVAAYASVESIKDAGWRQFASSSQLNRAHFDLGARNDTSEFHLSFTGADNKMSGTIATPVQMLNQNWGSVFTWPQSTHNQLAFLTANGSHSLSDTLTLSGNAYFRGYWQQHVDGNNTEAQACDAGICFGDGGKQLNGSSGLNLPSSTVFGQIDRTFSNAAGYGGSLQATSTAKIFDRPNNIVVGMSIDRGHMQFNAASELGTIDPNTLFVNGTGVIINQPPPSDPQNPNPNPTPSLAPVSLLSDTTYAGFYATDTFEITPRLAVTAGGRFNIAQITLDDQSGGPLSSDNRFERFNPVVGVTYKIYPNLTAYAGYSEANRAPTPLELGCADPARPCLIDNFLVSDPPLKQVVSHTIEGGLRGNFDFGSNGQLRWNAGVFHTVNTDDIINVASSVVLGQGYFLNAAKTLRQGVEAGITYSANPWSVYANYTFVDATYQTAMTLQSPNNPAADGNGNIFVVPGDHIPSSPRHRFKAGIEYNVTDAWKIGFDVNAIGSQYMTGDQSNQQPKVPPYAVVNLHGSYQINKNVELFGNVQNLFNQHYYTTGSFFSVPFFNLTDPRMFVPGMPLAAYAGLRVKF